LALRGCVLENRSLEEISRLTGLEVLDLRGSLVDDDGLSELGKLNLRRLGLAGTKIDGSRLASLHSLEKLEELNLSGTQLNDNALDQLERFPNLNRLDIRDTGISESSAAELGKRLPKCWIIMH
jgi:hypothetical protein